MAARARLENSVGVAASPESKLQAAAKLCRESLEQNLSRGADLRALRLLISCGQNQQESLSELTKQQLVDLSGQLLDVLYAGQLSLEEQLLTSTVFCVLLGVTLPQHDAVSVIKFCLDISDQPGTLNFAISPTRYGLLHIEGSEKLRLGLCHGLLQCRPNRILHSKNTTACKTFFCDIFRVLEKLCKKYSRLTIVAFKTLTRWLQCVQDMGMGYCLDNIITKTIFAIVNNNWENPINGVRKENIKILELLLDICNASTDWTSGEQNSFAVTNLLPTILQEQPWNMKSKYFMLAALLPRYGVVTALSKFPSLPVALVSSVQHPHLASAGCDAYKACLKHLHQLPVWCHFFQEPVMEVLSADTADDVGKQNLYNYWLTSTLKSFPDLLPVLLRQLATVMETRNAPVLLPIISLVHLGRKEGLIHNLWDGDWIANHTKSWCLNLLKSALQHSNEMIRNYAFGAVCICSKTSLFPSEQEFQTVQNFLIENANSDSSPLRQGILSSFVSFLLRLRDSFLQEMKKSQLERASGDLSKPLEFLEWLHSFCISNLEPGANYQRKILSLRLFQEILRYLGDDSGSADVERKQGLRRKGRLQGRKVKDYAVQCKKWSFNSEASHKCLLNCIMDPTDDIREIAGSILVKHFSNHITVATHVEETEALMRKALDLCGSTMFYETESGALLVKVVANMVHKKDSTNFDISHLVSRLVHNEPHPKLATFEVSEQYGNVGTEFQTVNFFEGPWEGEASSEMQSRELDNSASSVVQGHIAPASKKVSHNQVGCSQAERLLAALRVHKYRKSCWKSLQESGSQKNEHSGSQNTKPVSPSKHLATKITRAPGTYEGLIVMDPEYVSKIGDTDSSSLSRTFEGLTVVEPVSGEIGQHLNVPRANKTSPKHDRANMQSSSKDYEQAALPSSVNNLCSSKESFSVSPAIRDRNVQPIAGKSIRQKRLTPNPIERIEPEFPKSLMRQVQSMSNNSVPARGRQQVQSSGSSSASKNVQKSSARQVPKSYSHSVAAKKGDIKKGKLTRGFSTFPVSPWDWDDPVFIPKQEAQSVSKSNRHSPPTRDSAPQEHISSSFDPDWDPWGTPKFFPKTIAQPVFNNLGAPSSDRPQERSSLSPAPSLDWDDCGGPFPVQEVQLNSHRERVAPVLEDCGEEELDWWEMSSVTSLAGLLLCRAWAQWRLLCKDLCRAALTGSPLHGLLMAMTQLIAQSAPVAQDEVREMVALVEDVVQHLLGVLASKASKTLVAPSFAEMSEAIESAIQQSYSLTDDSDEQVSPVHQIVLNCTWLNLKACCILASELAKDRSTPAEFVERCEQVIVQVLLRCRHKGAIEAAGVALAGFVRTVTAGAEHRVLCMANGQQVEVKHLPGQLLTQFLDKLQEGGSNVSTTRRSAGLAILVHRIVANDMQPGKPLVELCVCRLLAVARMPLCGPAQLEQLHSDLPQAQSLHFLCTLMQDSALRQDMAPYVSDTALLCFDNFSSPMWTIRNAALQLFGALVPKLVGEKKFQDDDIEGYGNITIEEFFSHYPELVEFLLTSLTKTVSRQHPSLTQHSSLVPVLSLLSKLCVGSYSLMEDSLKETVQSFKVHFISLLSSEIFAVRKIAAKAYARFVTISRIEDVISIFLKTLSQQRPNENEIHGTLLAIKYLKERLQSDGKNLLQCTLKIEKELRKLYEISYLESASWLNKALIAEVCDVGFITYNTDENVNPFTLLKQILYTLKLHTSHGRENFGIYHWAKVEAELIFKKCSEEYLCQMWQCSYQSNWDELCVKCLSVLQHRLTNERQINLETKTALFHDLLATVTGIRWLKSTELLFHIYDTMLLLVTEHSLGKDVDMVTIQMLLLQSNARKENDIQCWSILLPLTCALFTAQVDNITLHPSVLYQVACHIKERTNADQCDESCRLDAARAFHLMYQNISHMFTSEFRESQAHYETKLMAQDVSEMILDAGIAFLQDEDSEVRKEAAKFTQVLMNPFACLEKLIAPSSVLTILSQQQAMTYLCNKLINLESCKQVMLNSFSFESGDMVLTSPFDHGTSNIYAEEIKTVHLFGKNLLLLIEDADVLMKYELDVLLHISLIEEDLNGVLTLAYHGKKSGRVNSTVRAALHVIDRKLSYLLKVKLALNGINVDKLQHMIHVYQKHLQEF